MSKAARTRRAKRDFKIFLLLHKHHALGHILSIGHQSSKIHPAGNTLAAKPSPLHGGYYTPDGSAIDSQGSNGRRAIG